MQENPEEENQDMENQGTDIHVGPGQEQHLPHEAWHVVQQERRRVKPTVQNSEEEEENEE